MICKCGGETKTTEHTVKTLKKALEWFPGITEKSLPVVVQRDVCKGCGRELVKTFVS